MVTQSQPTHSEVADEPGPTCQAAECAGSCGATLAIHTPRAKGGIQMAKKAKGGKKKAAKKR
jgi:hypothetical protein